MPSTGGQKADGQETSTPRTSMSRVTMAEVARVAGVTKMTVSNVLNGRANRVSAATAESVMRVCADLGYRSDASASTLRTSRRMAIGIVIVDPNKNYLADPFSAAFLSGINDFLLTRRYSIVLHGVSRDIESSPFLHRIETDGFCVFLAGTEKQRRAVAGRLMQLGQPMIFVQEALEMIQSVGLDSHNAATVLQDDYGGGALIAEHLLQGGLSGNVVMLVPEVEWPAMVAREAGFRSVLDRLDQRPRFHLLKCGDEGVAATQAAFASYIDSHGVPQIVFGGNDRMAIAAMKYLESRGIRVPGHVKVAGFNGFDFWRYCSPELTTVRSPAYELGQLSGSALVERIETGRFPFRQNLLPVGLIVNGSSVSAS